MAAPYRFQHVFKQIQNSLLQRTKIHRKSSVYANCMQCSNLCTVTDDGLFMPPQSLASQFKEAAKAKSSSSQAIPALCRTTESDPNKHGEHHIGMYYTVPTEHLKRWLEHNFRHEYIRLTKSLHEICLMVRKPAIEIMQYLKKADYSAPAIRYLLYGHYGNGKSHSMAHIMHYCALQDWLVLHVKFGSQWSVHYQKVPEPSSYKEGRYDQPVQAVEWLTYFKHMNEPLLKTLDLRCQSRYVWSKREFTEEGETLLQAIEFGLARPRYSSDIVGMLLKEIRLAASQGKMKVLVAVDGVNGFWGITKHILEDYSKIDSTNLTLVHNFKKMIKNDWNGGAVVLSTDEQCELPTERESYLPKYLLKKDGFEHLDPHIPVHVETYSEKEVHSCINYYLDTKWIQNPHGNTDDGRKELIFLSSKNPQALYEATRNW